MNRKIIYFIFLGFIYLIGSMANAKRASSGKKITTLATVATVASIKIVGNKKIETDAILNKIQTQSGREFSSEQIRQDVLNLYKTGYFEDIEVRRERDSDGTIILEYSVVEKPSVSEIVFEGNSEIKNEDLLAIMTIKNYEILNMEKAKESSDKMQKLYEDKGYFLAKVDVAVEDVVKGQSVKLVYKINENDKVKVKKITFLGNAKIPDGQLKSKMITTEGGYFSAISGSGQYKQEVFDRDIQIIRFLYYNQGYVQAKVDRPQVFVTPDKKSIYLTIRIEEGEQYNVGEVDFDGAIVFSKEELFSTIKIHKNGVFAYDVLQKDLADLTAKYGDLGYAYANVIPRTRFDDKNRKVDLVFEVDKGNKIYFGRISVAGNSKTRDKVVRRELKILEGELYNETRRRQSVESIQRLGFFEEVNFKTSVNSENLDLMDIEIVVKERNTGQIQLSAGYGSSQGFSMTGSVNEINFMGLGRNLGASLNLSSSASYYSLSYTEPYFRDTEWSLGMDAYQSANTARSDYDENHLGGALRTGYPIGENIKGFLQYKYDQAKLETKYDSNRKPITDSDLFPLETASGVTSSVKGTVEYDTRNDRFSPSAGILTSLSFEYAGLGGDIKYMRGNGIVRFFKNVFWDVVFRNSFQYGIIQGLDGRSVPFNELYLLGGPYSLRGYRSYRVGKMALSNKIMNELQTVNNFTAEKARIGAMRFVGGTQQLMYQGELQFPLIKEAGIYGVGFFDIGSADDIIKDQLFYSDVGFGLRWFSPIGPLRFEWGFPLNGDPNYHDSTVFEFSIGTPF